MSETDRRRKGILEACRCSDQHEWLVPQQVVRLGLYLMPKNQADSKGAIYHGRLEYNGLD